MSFFGPSVRNRNAVCSVWLVAAIFPIERAALAQEAIRNSIAGDAAAESHRIDPENLPFTVKAGDLRVLVSPSIGAEYNDNINLTKENRLDDFIIRPSLGLQLSYPLTQRNLLQFDISFGYSEYLQHHSYSTWFIQSGSALSFDLYIKDVSINLHDRFGYTQDSAREGAIANSGTYGTFQNSVGLNATWDLQDVTLSGGYDHQNIKSTSDNFEQTDHASEMVVGRVGLKLNPRLTAGMEGTVSFTEYEQKTLNDSVNYSGGVYADWQPGTYFHLKPRFGYTIYNFEQSSRVIKAHNQDTWYADLSVEHQVSEGINYTLSAGHETRLGIQSDTIEDWYLRPRINWSVFKAVDFSTSFFYEHGEQTSGGLPGSGETYDWYGGELKVGYSLTKKLSLNLNYRLTLRSSDQASREYTQNSVGLQATYTMK